MNQTAYQTSVVSKQDDEIDLIQLFRTVWLGVHWIVLFAAIGLFIGGYYAFVKALPIYTASATVVQATENQPIVDFASGIGSALSGNDQNAINTEIEVLRSRGLIEKLVAEMDLVQDPIFNLALRQDTGLSGRKVIEFIQSLYGRKDSQPADRSEQETLNAVVNNVTDSLSVSNIRQSYVYTLTAETPSATRSAELVNTLASLYIQNQVDVKNEANLRAMEWLSDRLGTLRQELETAESAVKDFNAGTDLINVDTLAALNRQIKELRDRLSGVATGRDALAGRLSELRAAKIGGDIRLMDELAADRVLTRLTAQAMTSSGKTAFDARFDQIILDAELALERLDAQFVSLEDSINQQEAAASQQSDDLLTLQQLEREAQASRILYEFFLSRLKETTVQSGIQQPDSRVLSRAVIPLAPSAPRKSIILAMSLILGTLFGTAMVVLREFTQNTYRSAEDLEADTGRPVFGEIPRMPTGKRQMLLDYLESKPASGFAESVRNMRTSILLSNPDRHPQVIMSTSSIPGEGKTTQSIALTQNLGGLGKKVILIEGDIRKRVFSEYFNLVATHSILSVIDGRATLDEAVIFEPHLKADILLSEAYTANPADVFSSEAFRALIAELRKRYDYIIIDTPPVLAVPDARIIGKLVDATVYTVRWDKTARRQVVQGIKSLESVRVKVSGLVLGQISPRGQERYGYGKGYGSYEGYHNV